MGFIYKDIAAFALNPGDIIAFNTGVKNDNALHFDLSLTATTANGGTTANNARFTFVSSLASGIFGDNIVGNYDIAFLVNTKVSFAGGGLITDFLNTHGAVVDNTGEQNLVSSINSPYNVGVDQHLASQPGQRIQPKGLYACLLAAQRPSFQDCDCAAHIRHRTSRR